MAAEEVDEGGADVGENERAEEGTGNGAGEGKVVVVSCEVGGDVGSRESVVEDVVGCLEGEGFFNFGVGGDCEVA